MGLDIGPKTIELFQPGNLESAHDRLERSARHVRKARVREGTLAMARAVAAATKAGATSIVGGGDSVAAVEQSGVAEQISHISTGGGASLEFLAGEKLPGVEALTDAPS